MNILIGQAETSDAQLMANLTRSAWANKVAVTSSGHRETSNHVMQHLHDGGGFILLVDNAPAGSVRWLPLELDADVWEILRMGVLPQYCGNNLSQHLVEAIIHHALVSNVKELRLAIKHDQSRLLALYSAYDFEVAPELEYSHANPLESPPIVMRRMLKR